MASAASAINLWYIENATNGALGQFAKRSLPEANDEVVLHPHLKSLLKRWPADEAVTEQERVANGTAALLGLIDLMESVFNLTLEESLYAVWPNPFLNSTPANLIYSSSTVQRSYKRFHFGPSFNLSAMWISL